MSTNTDKKTDNSNVIIDLDDNSNPDKDNRENQQTASSDDNNDVSNQNLNQKNDLNSMDIDLTLDDEDELMNKKSKDSSANETTTNDSNEKKNEPIIDLDDSDSDSVISLSPQKKTTLCINPNCLGDNEDLKTACGYSLSFYQVKYHPKRKQYICKQCRDKCLQHYEILANLMINNKPIFDYEYPEPNELVEINDSDEEAERENLLTEDEKQILCSEIEDAFERYNIDNQIKANIDVLENKSDKLCDDIRELEEIFNDMQTKIDQCRNQVYQHRELPKELQGIEIDENCVVTFTSKVAERRSSRKITKPSSYNESETEVKKETIPGQLPPKPMFVPKLGDIIKETPCVGQTYYAMKSAAFGAWSKCQILEILSPGVTINDRVSSTIMYRVQFEPSKRGGKILVKFVNGKQLAYGLPPDVRLPIGSRVIALFKEAENAQSQDLYAGIVAEPLSTANNFRYLIFFDDGYAQYVNHENVFLIVDVSTQVWDDVPIESRKYIEQYLYEYPERPMVKLVPGQIVRTERNGKWWPAKVLKVDKSLVLMFFENDNHMEWIYRGSRRLAPLFNTNQQVMMRQNKGLVTPQRRLPQLNRNLKQPYVEYTRETSDHDETTASRAVARKSTSSKTAIKSTTQSNVQANTMVPFLPTNTMKPQQGVNRVIYFTTRNPQEPGIFKPHKCSAACSARSIRPLSELKGYSILAKPLLAGWYRQIARYGKNKREVRYITPCFRSIRNVQELHLYLRLTKSEMSVDMFDFNYCIHALSLYSVEKTFVDEKDLSQGKEMTPIHVVNDIDYTMPEYMRYSIKREPTEGVHLNLDEEFLCGCECTDDCADKTKCDCWRLTIAGTKHYSSPPLAQIGYVYKRLLEPVATGIYECNSRCKCNKNACLNRVVQHPLQLRLQVFNTTNRGWGIRTLHDIPRGSFICIYAGELLTEQRANEGGINFGDEYFAELDYIEVVERIKEGYESDVPEDPQEDDPDINFDDKKDDDDDYDPTKDALADKDYSYSFAVNRSEGSIRTRSSRRSALLERPDNENSDEKKSDSTSETPIVAATSSDDEKKKENVEEDYVTISDDEGTVREPSSFIPTVSADEVQSDEWKPKHKSVRKMFGEDESCYIMDAKNAGNIGRFLNHSCNPNVFVQNVFVDTHDLRFPWVAFFALTHIRAGTELTWNYNYEVGSVPGKVLYCHCGSDNCRGKLL